MNGKPPNPIHDLKENGAPGAIRTPDPQIRSLVLYPAELRVPAKRKADTYSQPKRDASLFSRLLQQYRMNLFFGVA
jgi:hypothetical protein